MVPQNIFVALAAETNRADLKAFVVSGLFDMCIENVVAFVGQGVEALPDTHICPVYFSLGLASKAKSQRGCEAKIRSVAKSLAFCLENSMGVMSDMGLTTGSVATRLCA